MESPIAIANYFINKSGEKGQEITSMKLIKLVYISHGWHLALYGAPLVQEDIQAWKYGPVVKSVYEETKRFGRYPITELFSDSTGKCPLPNNSEVCRFLDKIWEVYGKFNGLQLSALTHEKGTPWDIAWNEKSGHKYNSFKIDNELIRNHYKAKLNQPLNVAVHA